MTLDNTISIILSVRNQRDWEAPVQRPQSAAKTPGEPHLTETNAKRHEIHKLYHITPFQLHSPMEYIVKPLNLRQHAFLLVFPDETKTT